MKMNRHLIAGKIVDHEAGYLPSGLATAKIRVMTDDGWYNTKEKKYIKRNTYHTVKAMGKMAEKMHNLAKDDWVMVEGQRLTDSWEDRDGEKKYADFLKPALLVEIEDPWENREEKPKSSKSEPDYPTEDDDIPF